MLPDYLPTSRHRLNHIILLEFFSPTFSKDEIRIIQQDFWSFGICSKRTKAAYNEGKLSDNAACSKVVYTFGKVYKKHRVGVFVVQHLL